MVVPGTSVEDLRTVFAELIRRQIEALNLYEPMPKQDEAHRCTAPELIVRGSNRAGKTVCTHVEAARALTGRDPYKKYPTADGRAFLVGKDNKHLGEVMYRKLFRAGAFKILKDPRTNTWRSWRPWDPNDLEFRHLVRPAPPLIPKRYVTEVAWENKKANVPTLVRLTSGWEANFFSSLGKPPQGSDIDLGLFDEEIVDPEWYPEISARLVDRNGRLIWGATPQAGTEQLYDLSLAAEDQAGREKPRIVEVYLTLEENLHLDDAQKQTLKDKFKDNPQEYEVRIEGRFAVVSFKFYPEFADHVHGVEYFPVPHSWTRYAITDPGHQECSVLFVATPPDDDKEFGGRRLVYDELVVSRCNAKLYGEAMAKKCQGQQIQAFILDTHGGRIPDMGSGQTVESQYSAALRENGVASVETGHRFHWGSDDFDGGVESVRKWLTIGAGGVPVMCYFHRVLKTFKRQMERYHYRRVGGVVTNRPVKKNDHLVDDLRYAAAHGCPYRKPTAPAGRESYAVKAVREKNQKRRKEGAGAFTRLGPGK